MTDLRSRLNLQPRLGESHDHHVISLLDHTTLCGSCDHHVTRYIFLVSQGFDESEVSFAKAAFSNLVGGVSYFYGKSKQVDTIYDVML